MEQLVASAQAAVDEVVRRGVCSTSSVRIFSPFGRLHYYSILPVVRVTTSSSTRLELFSEDEYISTNYIRW